jgi:histidyl-tRNA synthetase
MIAQQQQQLHYPLRWWSFGPFWRYESPQKGRGREFFQWNADLIGVDSPQADAESAALLAEFLKKVGLKPDQVKVFVNNRRLMEAELTKIGVTNELLGDVFRLIDRKDKLSEKDWEAYGADIGLKPSQLEAIQTLLTTNDLWKASEELDNFFSAVSALGVDEYIEYSPRIIRGLDYYTGTVFEALALSSDVRRSIAGGGRYDNLMADVGGDPLPGVGYAMGDMVITVVLEELGLLPKDRDSSPARVLVTVFDENTIHDSYQLSSELRREGIFTTSYPTTDKLGKQFRHADRIGAKLAIILGPDEITKGEIAIKDLTSGEQKNLPRDQAIEAIRALLDKA